MTLKIKKFETDKQVLQLSDYRFATEGAKQQFVIWIVFHKKNVVIETLVAGDSPT